MPVLLFNHFECSTFKPIETLIRIRNIIKWYLSWMQVVLRYILVQYNENCIPKTPRNWGEWEQIIYGCHTGTLIHITCPERHLCLHLKCKKFILFKANFLNIKGLKNIRKPPDCTGNEPKSDIHIGGSAGHKNMKWQILVISNEYVDNVPCSSPKYRNGG